MTGPTLTFQVSPCFIEYAIEGWENTWFKYDIYEWPQDLDDWIFFGFEEGVHLNVSLRHPTGNPRWTRQ